MKKYLLGSLLASSFGLHAQIVTFSYTGDIDSLIIPNCVDSVIISVWGAQGENAVIGGTGGKGAYATGRLDVNPGDKLYVVVGGQNGYNGGGSGGQNGDVDYSGTNQGGFGGSGGGASDVRIGGMDLTDRIIVAGGGGGGGHEGVWPGCQPAGPAGNGGDGSGTDGGTGSSFSCFCGGDGGIGGTPGTMVSGGTGGGTNDLSCGSSGFSGGNGALGIGGDGHTNYFLGDGGGGGGGGGYYGGGAGGNGYNTTPGGGGGGGSSFTGTLVNPNIVAGTRSGNGQVTITYILSTPIMTFSVAADGASLTALQNGVSYQWLNCDAAYAVIPGATSQTLVAASNGSYAVELDNGNGCVDTSACFNITEVSITESELAAFDVFPNPAGELVTISLYQLEQGMTISLVDVSGRVLINLNADNETEVLDLSEIDAGMYLVRLTTADGKTYLKNLIKN